MASSRDGAVLVGSVLLAVAATMTLVFFLGYAEGQGAGFREGRLAACLAFADGWLADGLPVKDGDASADEYYNLVYECRKEHERG